MLLVQLSGHWEFAVSGQYIGRATAQRRCMGSLGLKLGTQRHFRHPEVSEKLAQGWLL